MASDNASVDIDPLTALKKLRDEADECAERSLESDESAYDAYERVAGRAQYFIDKVDTDSDR